MAHFFLLTQPTIHSLSPYCHLGSVLSKMIIALSFSSSNCKYCILLWMDTYLASWTMMAIVCFLSHWKLCFMVCKPIEKDKGWVQANITSETETSILRANGVKRFCWNWVRRPGPRRPISAVGDPVHLCLKPYLRRLRNSLIQRHGPSFDVFFNLTVEGVGSHVFLLDGKAFPRAQFQQLWPSFVHLIYVRLVFRYQLSQLLQQSKEHLSIWGTHVSVWLSTTACIHLARNAKHPPPPGPGRTPLCQQEMPPDTEMKQQPGRSKCLSGYTQQCEWSRIMNSSFIIISHQEQHILTRVWAKGHITSKDYALALSQPRDQAITLGVPFGAFMLCIKITL